MKPDSAIELVLFDHNINLVRAWGKHFAAWPEVKIVHTKLQDLESVDAVVAAGNSYAMMDGELDLVMAEHWPGLQNKVFDALAKRGGYAPVGSAFVTEPAKPGQPYCVYAPTMRRPMNLAGITTNVFDATWAALWAIHNYDEAKRWKLAMPGLGSGAGHVPPETVAALMCEAWRMFRARNAMLIGKEAALRREASLMRAVEGKAIK